MQILKKGASGGSPPQLCVTTSHGVHVMIGRQQQSKS